ncbi:MAG: hypothetical protein GY866_37955 [Proteobacteria bacterium]|nr:hypothetical protein [Pseudomonadota bacterium]
MENPSQDDVVIALTEKWDKSLEEVFDILTTAVRSKAMISLSPDIGDICFQGTRKEN